MAICPSQTLDIDLCTMPELPEIETIRRAIEPRIVGSRITDISVSDPLVAAPQDPVSLQTAAGGTVRAVLRRGKHLILLLSGNSGVVLHLRMTGALYLREPPVGRRVRAALTFSNGERLVFTDTRRLGKLQFHQSLKPLLLGLGQEPLDGDFTAQSLHTLLRRHRIPVKAALLDQRMLAGVGNMYADEALYLAGINLLAPANELKPEQVSKLWCAIRDVLQRAIDNHGASVNTYSQPDGNPGEAQFSFNVAHRKGELCPRCGTRVERVMVRKRGAYYCPSCQPEAPGLQGESRREAGGSG